jgi:CRP/FNR family cyclic AMP-dependent transcriptional regulator
MHKDDNHESVADHEDDRRAQVDDLKYRELFEGVDAEAVEGIARHSMIRNLGAQERLYLSRGQVANIYIMLRGYVAIWINSQFTNAEETFLAWRGPEQIIGEMKAVADTPQEARIITCEPCQFIETRSDNFTDVANGCARIYRNIARLLVKKMEHERCRSEIIRMSPASRQVAQTLLHLAHERCGRDRLDNLDGVEIPGIIHQDEVAGYVGVERETINRQLSKLKKKKTIDYIKSPKGSRITILNRATLERIALGKIDETA